MEGKGKGTVTGTATGCFKCGRPGHWSRDCPFSPSHSDPNPNPNPNSSLKPISKPKKLPRKKPNLTPDLLLSDDGLGYVLRYFPRQFKYRGPPHEVRDLGNLLHLYAQWHSRLLPYYSFTHFIHKVEKVAATRRVKTSLGELRQRVASGGDPTKLREPPLVHDLPSHQNGFAVSAEDGGASLQERDVFAESENVNDIQEDMFDDIYDKATQEPSRSMHDVIGNSMTIEKTLEEVQNNGFCQFGKAEISEEQRARMEENRLKALQRRAARADLNQVS